MDSPPLLRMEGITKIFSGVTALDGVDFALERGEVHSLVGENGAGKSTLIKIMTGAYRRDGGRILLEGREVDFRSPEDAQRAGVVLQRQPRARLQQDADDAEGKMKKLQMGTAGLVLEFETLASSALRYSR